MYAYTYTHLSASTEPPSFSRKPCEYLGSGGLTFASQGEGKGRGMGPLAIDPLPCSPRGSGARGVFGRTGVLPKQVLMDFVEALAISRSRSERLRRRQYMYTYMYTGMCVYIYIYIYIRM